MVFHAQTQQSSFHKTVKVQSYVTTQVIIKQAPHLPQTLLASMHLPSVKNKCSKGRTTQIHGSYQQKSFTAVTIKTVLRLARLCFSLEFPLCVDIK